MNILLIILTGLYGTLFGSFANVVIARVPDGRSVISPPSSCPNCQALISKRDNIPIISWLLLKNQCRNCGMDISVRYPLVEALMGVLFAATTSWLLLREQPDFWAFPGMLSFIFFSTCLAFIDLDTKRLPNALTYILAPTLLVLLGGAALLNGEPYRILNMGIGVLILAGVLFIAWKIKPQGMGLGDVKYAVSMGLALGYVSLGAALVGFFLSFLIGTIAGLILMKTTNVTKKTAIPFGPYLVTGSFLGLFFGDYITDWYLTITGLSAL